ncbi:uncharacterized protein LOC101888001 [Musca domestica]|uniref:Uncharacterized protein LOC101888001 n=1 Tax=Musca domestica TaxID=7370 RepID=A0A1I8M4P5_MUSDO|nr:uncharacterized protein LOC101888001 [Musca domestica]
MQQLAKALLLVGLLGITAHAKTIVLAKDNVTSHLMLHGGGGGDGGDGKPAVTAPASEAGNLDKTVDLSTPSSAVEDWSLVCQQLCGAALGGTACSPYCKNKPVLPTKVQIENANTLLMDSKKQFMCPRLCGLQLGDGVCTCQNWTLDNLKPMKNVADSNVCSLFCDVHNVTLAGCSPCNASNQMSVDTTNAVPMSKGEQLANKIAVLSDVRDVITTTTTTTPNWNELCASLCKTGDGGSLCNCDLSPFFA